MTPHAHILSFVWLLAFVSILPVDPARAEQPDAVDSPVIEDTSAKEQRDGERSDETGEATSETNVGEPLPEEFEPGLLPAAIAVFPGVLLHGAGLWAAGDPQGAYRLSRIQGLGMLGTTLGLLGTYATGASRRTIATLYYPTLVSAAAFVMPWFADLYGSAMGNRSESARRGLAPVEARAGYAYIHDPHFDYSQFGHARAAFRVDPVTIAPEAWVALDDDNQRLRLQVDTRLLGPRTGDERSRGDGTFLDIETAATYHRFGSEDFQHLVFEAAAAGRYDMRRLSRAFGGSFAELSLGVGSQMLGYGGDALTIGEDVDGLLLMRTAYGVYLGSRDDSYGEVKLYYDHRHDDFAAGTAVDSTADGLVGHVGAEGFYYPSGNWGMFGDLQAGSAYIALAGVTFRFGGH